MTEIRKILLFLIGSTLLGALLAPWLWWGGQWLAVKTDWKFVREADFAQYFDRAVLIAAVLLLWPTVRSMRIGNRQGLGLERDPHGWGNLSIGFFSGLVCMGTFGFIMLQIGVFRMKVDPPWWDLLKIAITAFTVGTLEEWLFRGAILGFFRRALLDWPAIVCSSLLFSIVHFVKPPRAEGVQVDWLTGFKVLPSCFAQFADPMLFAAGFTTLFVMGLLLGWSVLRTKAVWLAIGLHAGLVLGKFGFTRLTKRSIKAPETLPWVGEDIIVGIGALGVLISAWIVAAILLNYATRRRRAPRW